MTEAALAGSFVAALLTLVVLSFAWRDNPLYRLAEHLFVGVTLGLLVVFEVHQVLRARLVDPFLGDAMGPRVVALVLMPLAALLVLRWAPADRAQLRRLSQLPVALAVGGLAGIAAQSWLRGGLLPQIGATIVGVTPGAAQSPGAHLDDLLVLAGVVLVLLHFVFTGRRRGAVAAAGVVGRVVLFVGLGVTLGHVVAGRLFTLSGRVAELAATPWLSLVALAMVTLGLVAWDRAHLR